MNPKLLFNQIKIQLPRIPGVRTEIEEDKMSFIVNGRLEFSVRETGGISFEPNCAYTLATKQLSDKVMETSKFVREYLTIIGHFDLVAKHCENTDFFDVNSKEYLDYAFDAIYELKGKIPLFEVNTGAIARGYRTTPYPAVPIIKELKNAGFGAVITSDCHDVKHFDCYYREARELLKTCGFNYIHILTESGFMPVKL